MTSINTLATSIFYIYTVFFDDRQEKKNEDLNASLNILSNMN